MIHIGHYNTLEILRETAPGLFLGDDEYNEILLPNKYIPQSYEIGEHITVFCYLDHAERPVATTLEPYIELDRFALLKAVEVNNIGAFMDWGLEKHLLVPYKEQAVKMTQGKWYLIYCYLDEKTGRLVGSSKTNQFINNEELTVSEKEKVNLIVSRHTDMGIEVIINQKHKGLVYKDELYEKVSLGQTLTGYVKKIRDDHKIDVTLKALGKAIITNAAEKILRELKHHKGFLPLHDKSDPDVIRDVLLMSKKDFKKGIGTLYKQKLITIKDNGVYLN
ncbi:S1 RNA-binding domain-containing protein [Leptobacterium sp. I13]|uniref:CvfB family protein n=1 Tax=Leptobacterium meishanense TaxID=3128904 RepID=UPI0030ECD998